MGVTCSCVRAEVKDRFDLQPFVMRRLPIFWIMGGYGSGKSTIACMLQKSAKFNVVRTPELVKDELSKGKARAKIIEKCMKKNRPVPDNIMITLIKEYIFLNYANCKGFIFVGFPIHLKQAKLFELEICKVHLIIYCTVVLDCFLGRMINRFGDTDTEAMRKKYVETQKECHTIYNFYSSKAIKLMNNYPPEDTCSKLIGDLEDFWGYKFERIYNKN